MKITALVVTDEHGTEHRFEGRGQAHVVRTHMGDHMVPEKSTPAAYVALSLTVEATPDA